MNKESFLFKKKKWAILEKHAEKITLMCVKKVWKRKCVEEKSVGKFIVVELASSRCEIEIIVCLFNIEIVWNSEHFKNTDADEKCRNSNAMQIFRSVSTEKFERMIRSSEKAMEAKFCYEAFLLLHTNEVWILIRNETIKFVNSEYFLAKKNSK